MWQINNVEYNRIMLLLLEWLRFGETQLGILNGLKQRECTCCLGECTKACTNLIPTSNYEEPITLCEAIEEAKKVIRFQQVLMDNLKEYSILNNKLQSGIITQDEYASRVNNMPITQLDIQGWGRV